jgi:Tfp pilus assembly protein PilN
MAGYIPVEMNEPIQEVGEERPVAPGLREMGSRVVIAVLGPNEDQALPRFMPYAPRFNLRPRRQGLPLWALPLIGAVLALLLVVPVAGAVQLIIANTQVDIEDAKSKATMRLKETAQYDAAQRRLEQLEAEKDALDRVAASGPRWSVLLDRLREQLPPGVRLTLIDADAGGKVTIEGESADIRALGTFIVYLRAYRDPAGKRFFEHPELFSTERPQRAGGLLLAGMKPFNFKMTMRVPAAGLVGLDEQEEAAVGTGGEVGRSSAATVSLGARP